MPIELCTGWPEALQPEKQFKESLRPPISQFCNARHCVDVSISHSWLFLAAGTSEIGLTSSAPSSGKQCSPQNYPLFPGGRCTSVFSLASQCRGIQASPSIDCPAYEYCCFSLTTPVTDRPTLPSGMCSPDNRLDITNGLCVETVYLSEQCAGTDISQSQNCRENEFCCYRQDGEPMTTRSHASTPTPSTATSTIRTTSSTSSSTGGGITSRVRLCQPVR